jgi:hypothetical protein
MKPKYLIALSAILVFAALGCGVLDTVVNQAVSGGKPAGTVADLWTDVPKMNGMNKVNMDLPIAAQLAMKAIAQGSFDFIAFTTTSSPQDVVNYYTADRMQSAGWDSTDTGGCTASTDTSSGAGGICVFSQTGGGKNNALMIVIAQDAKTKQTQLFFVRVTDVSTPTK